MAEQENKKYKEKDPAFLFYSQAWLEGTAEMTSEERGVYINLLCYQHQKKSLPSEMNRLAKLGGEGEENFMKIWPHIKSKFELINNRYVNTKLNSLIGDRHSRALKNKINGAFALLIRYSDLTFSEKTAAKNKFNYEDFLMYDDENEISQKVTEWYTKWKESIKDTNTNTNKDKDKNTSITNEGGLGDKLKYSDFKKSLLGQQLWCEEVCMKTGTSIDDLPNMIDNFISHCVIGGENHYTEKEFKSHFRNVCLSKIDIVKPKIIKSVEDRKEEFRKNVALYSNQYDIKMLEEFFIYWSQLDQKTNLLQWEKEKAFEIPNKLISWKENGIKIKQNGHSKPTRENVADSTRDFKFGPRQGS